jgi:hypothetical protein
MCRHDAEAQDEQRDPRVHHAVDEIASTCPPSGTSRAAALCRLRRARRDLRATVLVGEASGCLSLAGLSGVLVETSLKNRGRVNEAPRPSF